MDPYSAEQWMLERHEDLARTAERRARLRPETNLPVRSWMAGHLRSLADRLDSEPFARHQRPTA